MHCWKNETDAWRQEKVWDVRRHMAAGSSSCSASRQDVSFSFTWRGTGVFLGGVVVRALLPLVHILNINNNTELQRTSWQSEERKDAWDNRRVIQQEAENEIFASGRKSNLTSTPIGGPYELKWIKITKVPLCSFKLQKAEESQESLYFNSGCYTVTGFKKLILWRLYYVLEWFNENSFWLDPRTS